MGALEHRDKHLITTRGLQQAAAKDHQRYWKARGDYSNLHTLVDDDNNKFDPVLAKLFDPGKQNERRERGEENEDVPVSLCSTTLS